MYLVTTACPDSRSWRAWDAWLEEQGPQAGFLQTSSWAALHEAVNHARPHLCVVRSGDALVAGALLMERRAQRRGGVASPLRQWVAGRELECHEGPVLPGANGVSVLDDILVETARISARRRVQRVTFHGFAPLADLPPRERVREVFRSHGYQVTSWATRIVDIRQDDEALKNSISRAARKAINRCEREGMVVRECDSYDEYEGLFVAAPNGRRRRRMRHGRHSASWEAVKSCYRYFVAEDPAGVALATLGTYRFNGVATEIMSQRTPAGRRAGLPAQDLLHWEVMRSHRAAGDRWFDLAGFNPAPSDESERGISRFKAKWGGQVIECDRFHLDRPNLPRLVARSAVRLVRSSVRP